MRHLFHTRAECLRLVARMDAGAPTVSWSKVEQTVDPFLAVPGELLCRLDLNFVRLGKDQPMAVVAGRAPDRIGVMFFSYTDAIKAGDRIRCISGPVSGVFEIRSIPDPAVGLSAAHHGEVQVVEVAQSLAGRFPGALPEEQVIQ